MRRRLMCCDNKRSGNKAETNQYYQETRHEVTMVNCYKRQVVYHQRVQEE
jgi:hypothetical protein